ncbi:hypothetical protein VPNG_02712 [Cytospora leucostoma]|uniref:Heterokaryon incompatibility domain-containing protein n=1 Tax=Cytospora leucostoma TaxID=1230097 RepID=A0A423XJP7_9PEZI|nr:hypothetical protein VPNG_02712 [Cytospora leucostoma]
MISNQPLIEDSFVDDGPGEFVYPPISPDEIRCLVLEPGRGKEPLSCSLKVHRLADSPPYEAISYVWGDIDLCHEIKCNGRPLSITTKLRNALRQCRLPDRARVLWADFICIDQLDLTEKSHQVASMSKIYGQATRVLICFGPDKTKGCAQVACSWLKRFNQFFERTLREVGSEWDAFPYVHDSDPIPSDPRWASVANLTDHPWFERGWVVHEVSLSKAAVVCWGESRIDWLWVLRSVTWALRRSISVYRTFCMPQWDLYRMMYTSRYKDEAITLWPKDEFVVDSFIDALDTARSVGYTDDRDRIYSFLGLPVSAEIRDVVSINYANTKTVSQVFQDFACCYLDCTRNLMLLHYTASTNKILSTNSDCPSWVPQWNTYQYKSGLDVYRFARIVSQETPKMPWICDREGGGILRVRGLLMDSITLVSPLLSKPTTINDMAAVWWNCIRYSRSAYDNFPPLYAFLGAIIGRSSPGSLTYEQIDAAAKAFVRRLVSGADVLSGRGAEALFDAPEDDVNGPLEVLWDHILKLVHKRRVAVTRRGYYCLVPGTTRVGDTCAVLFGTTTPFILRGAGRQNLHKVVGDAFVTSSRKIDVEAGEVHPYRMGSGTNANEDWRGWGLKEQDIWLC